MTTAKIILTTLLLLLFAHCCISQDAKFKRYDNYSSKDNDNVTGVFVPTVDDCLIKSNAAPLTNGVVYNDETKVCKVLENPSNNIRLILHRNVGWVTFVKDISDQKRLVFKTSASQSDSQLVTNSFLNETGALFNASYNTAVLSFDLSKSSNYTYRSLYCNYWDVSKVWYQYWKDGLPVAAIVFDGTGLNISDWYSPAYILAAAPYSSARMRLTSFHKFTMNALSLGFPIVETSANCSRSSYMYTVSSGECGYAPSPYPKLLYSATDGPALDFSAAMQFADFMTITVKVASRVFFVP